MTSERARNNADDWACGGRNKRLVTGCCVVDNTRVCIYDEIIHNSLSIIPSAPIYL